jgi:alkylation response protein AidB-like acyl-CoA dehydrogenase
MDLTLSKAELELQARAREFTDKFLLPHELEVEENNGLAPGSHAKIKQAVIDYGLNALVIPEKFGGRGYSMLQAMLAREQLGRATGAMWELAWQPSEPLTHGTPDQIRDYLRPTCEGRRRDSYAITEPDAGSDPRMVKTSAVKRGSKYVVNGEKWFVTCGDIADFIILHAHIDGDPNKPTLFLVDKSLPGVKIKRTPRYMHTFVFEHPEFLFENVEVDESKMLGRIGEGFDLTKSWITAARLVIGGNTLGAATRALEEANAFAARRVQFGKAIHHHQAIEFMLADMAVEIMAAKSLLYRVAAEIDRGLDAKSVHARASAVKLYCSEMAWRVIDKAVQILGGRGYMRENPVERLYRDVRVERIWEGSSEIQRMIIGGQIKKRGLQVYTGW